MIYGIYMINGLKPFPSSIFNSVNRINPVNPLYSY